MASLRMMAAAVRPTCLGTFVLALGLGAGSCNGTETPETPGSGGTPQTGGSAQGGSGGTLPTTGGRATGGTSTGGVPATGGKASGGTSTGGVPASGGKASGGTATGGLASTGGTSGGSPSSCGLPAAGTSGVAKPSGTAGNLKVVNWAGFKGAVSYTFDDANSSQVSHYSELQALGVRYTFFLIGNKISSNLSTWQKAVADGHEIGNHTQTHNSVTQSDVTQCDSTIKSSLGVTPYTMANPNGTTTYSQWAQQLYFLDRGVSDGLMMPGKESPVDPFNTYCYIPATGAAASAFNGEVDSAVSQGGWRVVLVHGFTGGNDGAYQPVDIAQFTSAVTYAKGKAGLWIDSYMNVGAYWRGQNAFQKVTPTTSGSNQTWTWTLPAHFPPGKCLRVTVDGGTLTQNGSTLGWDSHGYYEVKLDAGSLTLSP
jgi:peptidoglycan/xylan/chitin deacetylase (PgdA/CDA1 family)